MPNEVEEYKEKIRSFMDKKGIELESQYFLILSLLEDLKDEILEPEEDNEPEEDDLDDFENTDTDDEETQDEEDTEDIDEEDTEDFEEQTPIPEKPPAGSSHTEGIHKLLKRPQITKKNEPDK